MDEQTSQSTAVPDQSVMPAPQIAMASTGANNYAGFLMRFVAVLIDSLLLMIPLMIIGVIFRTASSSTYNPYSSNAANPLGTSIDLLLSLTFIIYDVYFLYKYGATLGKKAMHIKVVSQSGSSLSLGRIILRETIGKWLSGFLLLGYLWVLTDSKHQAWHDKIAGTIVVKA